MTEIPRNLEMAMLNAIHTSSINGRERPISMCYVAVRAVLEAQQGIYKPKVDTFMLPEVNDAA